MVITDTVMVTATRETHVYVDDSGEAPAQSIMDSMNKFVESAASGGFEVSPDGGDALIKAIDRFLQWIASQETDLQYLQQPRKLGSSTGAKILGPLLPQVAADEQGFVTQLRALRDSLIQARQGILTAIDNYRRTDESAGSNLKNIGTEG